MAERPSAGEKPLCVLIRNVTPKAMPRWVVNTDHQYHSELADVFHVHAEAFGGESEWVPNPYSVIISSSVGRAFDCAAQAFHSAGGDARSPLGSRPAPPNRRAAICLSSGTRGQWPGRVIRP